MGTQDPKGKDQKTHLQGIGIRNLSNPYAESLQRRLQGLSQLQIPPLVSCYFSGIWYLSWYPTASGIQSNCKHAHSPAPTSCSHYSTAADSSLLLEHVSFPRLVSFTLCLILENCFPSVPSQGSAQIPLTLWSLPHALWEKLLAIPSVLLQLFACLSLTAFL